MMKHAAAVEDGDPGGIRREKRSAERKMWTAGFGTAGAVTNNHQTNGAAAAA